MNNDTLLILLTIFVGITSVAFAGIAIAAFRLARTAQQLKERVDAFLPKAEKLIANAESTLAEGRSQIKEITSRAADILDLTRTQIVRVDDLLADVAGRTKVQLDRAEIVLDDTVNRVQTTVSAVQGTVLKPIREISGVAAGVKAAVSHLLKGAPANVAQATADEEMFI